jgi:hypothetical protein
VLPELCIYPGTVSVLILTCGRVLCGFSKKKIIPVPAPPVSG